MPGDVQRAWFGRGAHGKAERDWPLLLTIDLSDVCLIVMACGKLSRDVTSGLPRTMEGLSELLRLVGPITEAC